METDCTAPFQVDIYFNDIDDRTAAARNDGIIPTKQSQGIVFSFLPTQKMYFLNIFAGLFSRSLLGVPPGPVLRTSLFFPGHYQSKFYVTKTLFLLQQFHFHVFYSGVANTTIHVQYITVFSSCRIAVKSNTKIPQNTRG